MKLIKFLFKTSPLMVIMAIVAGVISGVSSTILLALIGKALSSLSSITPFQTKTFIALCVLVPIMRFVSEALLMRIGQVAVYKQRPCANWKK